MPSSVPKATASSLIWVPPGGWAGDCSVEGFVPLGDGDAPGLVAVGSASPPPQATRKSPKTASTSSTLSRPSFESLRTSGPSRLVDDDVDKAARDEEDTVYGTPLRVRLHLLAGKGELLCLRLADVDRHLEAVAQLAVDLDDEGVGLGAGEFRVGLGPALGVDAVGPAGALPQLLGDVGHAGGEHDDEVAQRFVPGVAVDWARLAGAGQVVGVLHQRRDHRVEAEVIQVVADAPEGAVGPASHLPHRLGVLLAVSWLVQHELPDAV